MNIVGVVPSKMPHRQNSMERNTTINGIFLNIIIKIYIENNVIKARIYKQNEYQRPHTDW